MQQTPEKRTIIMNYFKGLQRTLMASAVAVLAFGAAHAMAGPFTGPTYPIGDTVAGSCVGHGVGVGFNDCGTATGHIGVSVVGTLSINELQAVNFGNVAVTKAGNGIGSATLTPAGAITLNAAGLDGLTLISGANANGGSGGGEPGQVGNDGQHPGIYAVSGANEGGNQRVYISFADTSTNPLDANGDNNYPLNNVTVFGPAGNTFTVKDFVFTAVTTAGAAGTNVGSVVGKDVYGNYVDTTGGTSNTAFYIDVGATLSTSGVAGAYKPGKYVGEFNITASY
jgi:hypothetical protein